MARFHGLIGFEEDQTEIEPGIYAPSQMTEKPYFGDIKRSRKRWAPSSNGSNDDLILNNQISIVCDAYMDAHWPGIKYVKWNTEYWKVDSVEIKRPRILLTLGGVWNGHKAGAAEQTAGAG